MRQLLEPPLAVGALVRFLSRVDADVLHQLVVGRERLQALVTLVRLDVPATATSATPCSSGPGTAPSRASVVMLPASTPAAKITSVEMHGRLGHQILKTQKNNK